MKKKIEMEKEELQASLEESEAALEVKKKESKRYYTKFVAKLYNPLQPP